MMRRVVFDTSTLVGAALRIGSVSYQALTIALGTCELCASEETLAELEQVSRRRKFDRYLDRRSREEFVAVVRRRARLFSVPGSIASLRPACRDAKDRLFLALALAAQAELIVSSDDDLLVLNPWRGIPIVTASEFISDSDPIR